MSSPEQRPGTSEHAWFITLFNLLYDCQFELALTAEGHHEFNRQLGQHLRNRTSGVGELFVKILPAPESTRFDARALPWMGVKYDYVIGESQLKLQTQGVYMPFTDYSAPEEKPAFKDCDFVTVTEDALNWSLLLSFPGDSSHA